MGVDRIIRKFLIDLVVGQEPLLLALGDQRLDLLLALFALRSFSESILDVRLPNRHNHGVLLLFVFVLLHVFLLGRHKHLRLPSFSNSV